MKKWKNEQEFIDSGLIHSVSYNITQEDIDRGYYYDQNFDKKIKIEIPENVKNEFTKIGNNVRFETHHSFSVCGILTDIAYGIECIDNKIKRNYYYIFTDVNGVSTGIPFFMVNECIVVKNE
jgi:hypothetical protein